MRQLQSFFILLVTVFLFSACSSSSEDTNNPLTLGELLAKQGTWRSPAIKDGDDYYFMSVSFNSESSGVIYTVYPSGMIANEEYFSFTTEGKQVPYKLHVVFDGGRESNVIVTQMDADKITFTLDDGKSEEWTPYSIADQAQFDYYDGQAVPDDLREHPDWYEFYEVNAWYVGTTARFPVPCLYNSEKQLVVVSDINRFCKLLAANSGPKDFTVGDTKWYITGGYLVYVTMGNEQLTYAVMSEPANRYDEGQKMPASVVLDSEANGFAKVTVTVEEYSFSNENDRSRQVVEAWGDEKGFFVAGSKSWQEVYHKWNGYDINSLNFDYTYDGIYTWDESDKWWIQYDNETNRKVLVFAGTRFVEKVHWIDNKTIETNSSASVYSSALGYSYSGSIFFDVYEDIDVASQVTVYSSSSWLYNAKLRVAYRKGETYNDGKYTYDCTRLAIDWAKTSNSGAERTGIITIYVNNIDGRTYSRNYYIKQYGTSSSYGGGGSSGGSSGSSSSGSNSGTYERVSVVKIIEVKGIGFNSNSYSRSTAYLYKQKASNGKMCLYTSTKTMIGVASSNIDKYCGKSNYSVGSYQYKVVEYGVTNNTYYYFN